MTAQPGSQSYKKKLIEGALPFEAINREAARENSIRQGHPSILDRWWAGRPLVASRATVLGSFLPGNFPRQVF